MVLCFLYPPPLLEPERSTYERFETSAPIQEMEDRPALGPAVPSHRLGLNDIVPLPVDIRPRRVLRCLRLPYSRSRDMDSPGITRDSYPLRKIRTLAQPRSRTASQDAAKEKEEDRIPPSCCIAGRFFYPFLGAFWKSMTPVSFLPLRNSWRALSASCWYCRRKASSS